MNGWMSGWMSGRVDGGDGMDEWVDGVDEG